MLCLASPWVRRHGNIQRSRRFVAQLGRHRELLPLNFGLGIGYKLTEGHRMHGNALFDQPVEEHAPMRGLAAVEPKREFIEISLQVIFFKGTLMRTHHPALNQRGNAVYARQDLVGIFAGYLDGRSLVDVFVFGCAWIGCKPVGVDRRAGFDVLLNKRLERFGFCVGDNLQAAAPETFWGEQFHGDRYQHLSFGTAPAFAVPHPSKDGFINLDLPGQHIVPGMADCAPEPVQHRPSRLIGTEPEDTMQRFGGNAIFSSGQMPSGGKPNGQRCSGSVKDRARRSRYTTDTRFTPPPPVFHAPRRDAATVGANKAMWPTNPIKVVKTGSIIWKPRHKFGVVARVIDPGSGRF